MLSSTHERFGADRDTTLFPISDENMRVTMATFAEFTQEEVDVIYEANLGMLTHNDPIRFLLEGGVRPEEPENAPESTKAAYRAYRLGVCAGAVMIRKSLYGLRDEGFDVEPHTRDYAEVGRQVADDLPWRFDVKKSESYRAGISAKYRRVHDLSGYLEHSQALAFLGYLKAIWRDQQAEIAQSHEYHEQVVEDLITLGVRDVFTFYSIMYDEKIEPKLNDNFIFDPRKHFLPPDTSREELALSRDDVTNGQTLEMLAELTPGCGYRGEYRVAYTERDGSTIYATKPVDEMWSNSVPADVVLTHVRAYDRGYVMPKADRENSITQVGMINSLREIELAADDVLLLQRSSGGFAELGYPFQVNAEMAPRNGESSQLLLLVRSGEVTRLASDKHMSDFEKQLLERKTQKVIIDQQQR